MESPHYRRLQLEVQLDRVLCERDFWEEVARKTEEALTKALASNEDLRAELTKALASNEDLRAELAKPRPTCPPPSLN